MADHSQDLVSLHRLAGEWFELVAAQIPGDGWDRPTPCPEWDVRDLVNHVVSENLWVVPLMEGKTVDEVGDIYEGDMLGDHPVGAYAHSFEAADQAISEPGAIGRSVTVSYGTVPAEKFVGHRFVDLVVHGWDLAAAIGADRTLEAGLAAATWAEVEPQIEFLGSSSLFGEPERLGDDATTQDRILAATGRDPDWRAAR